MSPLLSTASDLLTDSLKSAAPSFRESFLRASEYLGGSSRLHLPLPRPHMLPPLIRRAAYLMPAVLKTESQFICPEAEEKSSARASSSA